MKLIFQQSLAACLLLTLSGCASDSLHRDKAIETSHYSPDQSLIAELPISEGKHASWWTVFDDPTLNSLVDKALDNNLSLQAALTNIKANEAELGITQADDNVQLSLVGGYDRGALSEQSPLAMLGAPTYALNQWQLGTRASWELDLWGYLDSVEASAKHAFLAHIYEAEAVKITLTANVVRQYLLLRQFQIQKDKLTQISQLTQHRVALLKKQAAHGLLRDAQVANAEAEAQSIQAQLPPLTHQISQQIHALAVLLGETPNQLNTLLTSPPGVTIGLPTTLPISLSSEVVKQRPDIQKAEAELRSALAMQDAAEADFYPRVSIDASAGFQAFSVGDLAQWGSRTYSVAPTFHLPIFDGGRTERTLALRDKQQKVAAIHYQQTVLKAWQDVADALSYVVNAKHAMLNQQKSVEHASWSTALTEKAYRHGAVSQLEVVDANRFQLSSELKSTQANTDALLAIVSLYRAVGANWNENLAAETKELAE